METSRRDVHAQEGAADLEGRGLRFVPVLREEEDGNTASDHEDRFLLLRVEMSVWTNVRIGFDGIEESVTTGVLRAMEIPVAPQAWG